LLHKNFPYRRHQEWKHKQEARNRWFKWFGYDMPDKMVGILSTTPQVCSCWMRGNKRDREKDTRQEIASYLEMKEELAEGE